VNELEIHEAKDAVLHLQTAFVMIKLKVIDGVTDAQMGEAKPPFDGTGIANFQFTIDQRFQGGG
jgi:hypothetical protein